MSSVADNVRARAVETASASKAAVVSRSYLYPPMGLVYLITHSVLWPPVLSRILPCLGLSLAVLVPMFLFAYLPQAAVLTFLNGPLGPINAAALVLSESTFLIMAIAKAFLLEGALLDLFDATLVHEGQDGLVAKGRELKSGSNRGGVKKLGKMLSKPLQKFSPAQFAEYLALLPLNLIPIVGTAVFLVIQGRKSGPSYHARYFQLKGFSDERRNQYIKENQGAYIAFGTMAMVMNLIPLVSIFFTFTSTVGAALWAIELEKGASHPGQVVGSEVTGPSEDHGKKEL